MKILNLHTTIRSIVLDVFNSMAATNCNHLVRIFSWCWYIIFLFSFLNLPTPCYLSNRLIGRRSKCFLFISLKHVSSYWTVIVIQNNSNRKCFYVVVAWTFACFCPKFKFYFFSFIFAFSTFLLKYWFVSVMLTDLKPRRIEIEKLVILSCHDTLTIIHRTETDTEHNVVLCVERASVFEMRINH